MLVWLEAQKEEGATARPARSQKDHKQKRVIRKNSKNSNVMSEVLPPEIAELLTAFESNAPGFALRLSEHVQAACFQALGTIAHSSNPADSAPIVSLVKILLCFPEIPARWELLIGALKRCFWTGSFSLKLGPFVSFVRSSDMLLDKVLLAFKSSFRLHTAHCCQRELQARVDVMQLLLSSVQELISCLSNSSTVTSVQPGQLPDLTQALVSHFLCL